ncbi:unnamed protein product, partial [Ectocarpus sp. 8 AP-2014]
RASSRLPRRGPGRPAPRALDRPRASSATTTSPVETTAAAKVRHSRRRKSLPIGDGGAQTRGRLLTAAAVELHELRELGRVARRSGRGRIVVRVRGSGRRRHRRRCRCRGRNRGTSCSRGAAADAADTPTLVRRRQGRQVRQRREERVGPLVQALTQHALRLFDP